MWPFSKRDNLRNTIEPFEKESDLPEPKRTQEHEEALSCAEKVTRRLGSQRSRIEENTRLYQREYSDEKLVIETHQFLDQKHIADYYWYEVEETVEIKLKLPDCPTVLTCSIYRPGEWVNYLRSIIDRIDKEDREREQEAKLQQERKWAEELERQKRAQANYGKPIDDSSLFL